MNTTSEETVESLLAAKHNTRAILASLLVMQPGYVGSLLVDGSGQVVLVTAAGLWAIGGYWLMRLCRAVSPWLPLIGRRGCCRRLGVPRSGTRAREK